jgi:protein arginine N-methyltransferase 5
MDAKSEGMISWFPIYFPLKVCFVSIRPSSSRKRKQLTYQTPLSIPENSHIVVTMYRQTDDRKVWYEWVVEVFALEKAVPVSSSPSTPHPPDDATRQKKEKGTGKPAMGAAGGLKRVRIATSELHSSIKEGCSM